MTVLPRLPRLGQGAVSSKMHPEPVLCLWGRDSELSRRLNISGFVGSSRSHQSVIFLSGSSSTIDITLLRSHEGIGIHGVWERYRWANRQRTGQCRSGLNQNAISPESCKLLWREMTLVNRLVVVEVRAAKHLAKCYNCIPRGSRKAP